MTAGDNACVLNRTALRIALARRQTTLKEVARETGFDLLRIYRISSKNVRPRPEELEAIARSLGLEPADLEDADGSDKPT